MNIAQLDGGRDEHEQLLGSWIGIIPYVLLAASTLLAVLEAQPWSERVVTLGLSALAATWMLWMLDLHPSWQRRHRLMDLYCCGLVTLIAVLLWRSPWFGFWAFTGYLHTWHLLRGPWRILGVTATAVFSTSWLTGGLPAPTIEGVASYVIVVAVTVAMVCLFSFFGQTTSEHNQQRKGVIRELAAANSRLETALQENTALQAQIVHQAREAGIQDERQRMAREIHDTIAQNLAGIITQLEAAERRTNPEHWQQHFEQARSLARLSLVEARRSVQALGPAPLDTSPLPQALNELAQDWSKAQGIALHFEITGTPQPLLREIESTLFRVTQEALTNVAKHARASRVGLTLSFTDDVVLLDVRDDGVGFCTTMQRPGDGSHGYGLHAMEQRLGQVAGTLTLESDIGVGTALNAVVPSIIRGAER